MKRLIALSVALCIMCGFVGCGSKPDSKPTTPTTAPTTAPTTTPTTARSFAGKTLHIAGMGNAESFTDYEKFGEGNYSWMMRAAIDEWAEINGVTIKYIGSFNSDISKPDVAPGEQMDIIFQTNTFHDGLGAMFASWTETEYNTLAELLGDKRYLDMMNDLDKSCGVVLPWAYNVMLYFNRSMFTRYNVKSPLDYWNEDNWTWQTFEICLKEITKDTDGDGTKDIYGINNDSWANLLNPVSKNEKGELVNNVEDPWIRDFFELKYNAYAVDVTSTPGNQQIQSNVYSPMWAMQISDCCYYDYTLMFPVLSNGDQIVAVPLPKWTGENGESKQWLKWMQHGVHLYNLCDEREAAFDLICYVIKCGMKYMSDYSLGALKCDYAGIQGASELSAKWKTAFSKVLENRKTDSGKILHYDAAHITKVSNYLTQVDEWYTDANYGGFVRVLNYGEITQMPPATAIPAVKEKYQKAIEIYNELYINRE